MFEKQQMALFSSLHATIEDQFILGIPTVGNQSHWVCHLLLTTPFVTSSLPVPHGHQHPQTRRGGHWSVLVGPGLQGVLWKCSQMFWSWFRLRNRKGRPWLNHENGEKWWWESNIVNFKLIPRSIHSVTTSSLYVQENMPRFNGNPIMFNVGGLHTSGDYS